MECHLYLLDLRGMTAFQLKIHRKHYVLTEASKINYFVVLTATFKIAPKM